MILKAKTIEILKNNPNSAYDDIKTEFLYHSNKLEGSTFTKENLEKYLAENIVEGSHKVDDVYETIQSTKLFDFVIDTLGEPISKGLMFKFHRMLKANTLDYERGFSGCFKKIPNRITGTALKLAEPWEVEIRIDELLSRWESSEKDLNSIIRFHAEFEQIHPFQDGNGRVGRFLILKQCIENEVDLILIDDHYSPEYKQALYEAQSKREYVNLENIIKQCQRLLDEKLQFLAHSIHYVENETPEI